MNHVVSKNEINNLQKYFHMFKCTNISNKIQDCKDPPMPKDFPIMMHENVQLNKNWKYLLNSPSKQ